MYVAMWSILLALYTQYRNVFIGFNLAFMRHTDWSPASSTFAASVTSGFLVGGLKGISVWEGIFSLCLHLVRIYQYVPLTVFYDSFFMNAFYDSFFNLIHVRNFAP
jgi:hypothetical protein